MEILFENDFIQIRINREHKCVECQAKKYDNSSNQFITAMEKVFEFICRNGCNKLLPVLGDMSQVPEEVLLWVESNWFPRLIKKGVKTYAVVSQNPNLTKSVSAKNPRNFNGITTVYFESIIKARSWIASLPN